MKKRPNIKGVIQEVFDQCQETPRFGHQRHIFCGRQFHTPDALHVCSCPCHKEPLRPEYCGICDVEGHSASELHEGYERG